MILERKNQISGRVRLFAWIAVFWERLWPCAVPAFLVAIVFSIVSWFGLWQVLPPMLHYALIAMFFVGFLYSLIYLKVFKFPDASSIERRIEIKSELSDRPVTAQSDTLQLGKSDGFSNALWQAHQVRMAKRLGNLRSGAVKADGNRHDKWGLRHILPIIAFLAFMTSFGTGGRLSDFLYASRDNAKLLTRLDIWIDPPNYTTKPPVYLSTKNPQQERSSITVPQFSQLKARFAGEGEITLDFGDGQNQIELALEAKPGEKLYSTKLGESGILRVRSGKTDIAQWSIKLVRDSIPKIKFTKIPDGSIAGSLQLSYQVSDDYGVVNAQARIEPVEQLNGIPRISKNGERVAAHIVKPGAISLVEPPVLKLPLPRHRAKSGSTKVNRDLSKHPLAGGRVVITLVARDDAGQEGFSKPVEITLPGRSFTDPVSKAIVEQRRILASDRRERSLVADMLDALVTAPEIFIPDLGTYLSINIARRRLVNANNDDQLREVLDLMWEIALGIEYGKLSDAERRLRDAQEKLSEALERDASDEEIDRLMKELRQAMNELMQALAEQNTANANQQNNNSDNAQTMRQRDLQKMLDRIENLAKSGSKDAARELLAQMQRLMDNLRAGRHQQQRQTEGDQENQALNKLGEMMKQQQEIMNETFRMQQQNPGQGDNNQNQNRNNQQNGQQNSEPQNQQQGQQNKNGDQSSEGMSPQEYADALEQLRDQQRALQKQLDALNQQLRELGLQPSADLGEAGKQMGEAGDQLGQGEAGPAVDSQGNALSALRKGAQSIMQQMAGDRQQGGRQQGQGQQGSGQTMQDPLGRQKGSRGPILGADTKVPGEIDAELARRVLDAIRERLSNPLQQLLEKNYLERLLKNR